MTSSPVLQQLDPFQWKVHRYGLPASRWEQLQNRSYWITGAGSGFGMAMSVALASAGAHVFLTGRRESKLRETVEYVKGVGGEHKCCHLIPADLSDPIAIEKASALIHNSSAGLDGVINSAAVAQRMSLPYPLIQEAAAYWDDIMHINVRTPWLVTRSVIPGMARRGAIKALF